MSEHHLVVVQKNKGIAKFWMKIIVDNNSGVKPQRENLKYCLGNKVLSRQAVATNFRKFTSKCASPLQPQQLCSGSVQLWAELSIRMSKHSPSCEHPYLPPLSCPSSGAAGSKAVVGAQHQEVLEFTDFTTCLCSSQEFLQTHPLLSFLASLPCCNTLYRHLLHFPSCSPDSANIWLHVLRKLKIHLCIYSFIFCK